MKETMKTAFHGCGGGVCGGGYGWVEDGGKELMRGEGAGGEGGRCNMNEYI
jgi:hypothetical protein